MHAPRSAEWPRCGGQCRPVEWGRSLRLWRTGVTTTLPRPNRCEPSTTPHGYERATSWPASPCSRSSCSPGYSRTSDARSLPPPRHYYERGSRLGGCPFDVLLLSSPCVARHKSSLEPACHTAIPEAPRYRHSGGNPPMPSHPRFPLHSRAWKRQTSNPNPTCRPKS